MVKSLVTKLKGSVSNTDLLRLGEMRIYIKKETSPTAKSRSLQLNVSNTTVLEIVGNGYFTDKTLSENKGKTTSLTSGYHTIYVSNDDVVLAILNKYGIVELYCENYTLEGSANRLHKSFDLEGLKYSTRLRVLQGGCLITGDISLLGKSTNLTTIYLPNSLITGDISSLRNLVNLEVLNLETSSVTGDISSLSKLTKLNKVYLRETKTYGNASCFASASLTMLLLDSATLNLADFVNSSLLQIIEVYNVDSINGDLALLPNSLSTVLITGDGIKKCTWTSRDSSAKIIAMPFPLITENIDKMLQDQAKCQSAITSSTNVLYKKITAIGTRTSASDDAVATLQNKGYTVSITPAQ